MVLALLTLRLHMPWVHSLKEKRMERQSLLARLRNQFNISAAETDEQDTHQILVISIVSIAADSRQADSILDHILDFVEANTEAEILSAERELL